MRACETCADRLKLAEARAQSLATRLALRDAEVAEYKQQVSDLQARAALLEKANAERKEASAIEDRRDAGADLAINTLREMNAEYKTENNSLRRDLESCRSSRYKFALGGAAAGAVFGVGLSR